MTSPLTILQVGAFPFPLHQGSQVYVRGMAQALARRGHRVVVATWGHGEGPDPEGVTVLRGRGSRGPRVVRSGPHWARGLHDLALLAVLRRALGREQVDVVHAHNVEAPVLSWLARGRRRVPLVYDQHTRMAEELPTYVRWKGLARTLGRALDRGVPALCDATVALSEEGEAALRRDGTRRVLRLPPAVALGELDGARPDVARQRWDLGGRPWVIYAGNTDAYQDLPVWLEAMARVPEAGLLLVTGDPLAPFEAACDRLGIGPGRRRLVCTTAFPEVRDLLAASTVAVSPRSQCAGFPIKLLNSLGLGVPTVAAEGSARPIPGIVSVPNRDPVALAGALTELLAHPEGARRLGQAGRTAVRAHWSWEVRAVELEALYRDLASGGIRTPSGEHCGK